MYNAPLVEAASRCLAQPRSPFRHQRPDDGPHRPAGAQLEDSTPAKEVSRVASAGADSEGGSVLECNACAPIFNL